jgi:hypothetical protein
MRVSLEAQACPACLRTDGWCATDAIDDGEHNPSICVECDCGRGRLVVVID